MADSPIEKLIRALPEEQAQPFYLVHGDLVVAEPSARRLAEAIAEVIGTEVEMRRRPARLSPILEDLRTLSLFSSGKVTLVVDSAAFADRNAAAALIDEIHGILPLSESAELSGKEREAASRLLQTLRLFDLDPMEGDPEAVVSHLPDWSLAGAKKKGGQRRSRGKRQIADLRQGLGELLRRARSAELAGWSEHEISQLGDVIHQGLPSNHCLVLAERTIAKDHPLLQSLAQRSAVVSVGQVASENKGGWQGLDLLAGELQRQTGVEIARDALAELARRTLKQTAGWGNQQGVQADSTARLAGEYRKLANLAKGGRIDRSLVEKVVLDRGQEDVWKILDAVGSGRGQEASTRLRRYLSTGEDIMAARFSFFSLLAGFCRQLLAVRGMMRLAKIPGGERNYARFKSQYAPSLQRELSVGGKNPLAGIHPFRLHRAYLAASRMPEKALLGLPWRVLETELFLKGESTDPDAALQNLLIFLASP